MELTRNLFRLPVFVFVFLSISISHCQSRNDKEILEDFNNLLYTSEQLDMERIYNHIRVHEKLENNSDFEKYLKHMVKQSKNADSETSENVQFLSYQEMSKSADLKQLPAFKNLVYDEKETIYYLVTDGEVSRIFSIQNGKINSFFQIANFGMGNGVYPLDLRKEEALKYIETINSYIGI